MLFGVKANVGSNPTVTAMEKDPCFLFHREAGVFCFPLAVAALCHFPAYGKIPAPGLECQPKNSYLLWVASQFLADRRWIP
jgi:hypothetical protein